MVTVIIPVRNGARFIAEAIDSILSQTLADLELLLVDDASTDRTQEIIQSYTDPRLRVLRNPQRMGVSASRNRALAEAKADYVAFLDADDVAYDQRLERQIAFLIDHPEVALVGSHLDYIDTEGRLLYSERPGQRPCSPAELRTGLLHRACILPSTATGRKAALLEAGGFPRMDYAEDHELWCRIAVNHELAILPDRLAAYRYHPDQATFRKISRAHKATQTCIRRAEERFSAAGMMLPADRASRLTAWQHLRGQQGSLGAAYSQWAELQSWALRDPRHAVSLAGMALLYSPLNMHAWKTLLRSAESLLLPTSVSRSLRWHGAKLRSCMNGKDSK